MHNSDYKYFAFISYNSHDLHWGKRLQRKLEHYRMPATLCSEKGWTRTPIRPVFFAPTDIQPGGLTKEIQDRLRASRHLIVICSPNSAQSEWVGKEIAFFHEIGRAKNIHFFIVDGIPHSGSLDTECFNPVVKELGLPEILGANINERIFRWGYLNKERAYVQLISKLLEVEFDSIWKRHRRILLQRIVTWILVIVLMALSIVGVWASTRSVDIRVRLNETSYHNDQLPPLENAVITMELDNEVKAQTLKSLDGSLIFRNIPHRFLGGPVCVKVQADRDYLDIDTVAILKREMTIDVCRDSAVYGKINFRLWNPYQEKTVGGKNVYIDGRKVYADENGMVQLYIPLKYQKKKYRISADIPLQCDSLNMPCGKDVIVLTQ